MEQVKPTRLHPRSSPSADIWTECCKLHYYNLVLRKCNVWTYYIYLYTASQGLFGVYQMLENVINSFGKALAGQMRKRIYFALVTCSVFTWRRQKHECFSQSYIIIIKMVDWRRFHEQMQNQVQKEMYQFWPIFPACLCSELHQHHL